MKKLAVLLFFGFSALSSHAYVITPIEKSVVMPHLEKAIKTLCPLAKQSCYVKSFKVTQVLDAHNYGDLVNEELDEAIYKISRHVFVEQYVSEINVDILSKNASQLPRVKTQVLAVSKAAVLSNDPAAVTLIDLINVQIYKLAEKGRVYFGGGETYSPFGNHTVFVAVRLSKSNTEAEVLTWDAGYTE